jgi:nitrogen fixation NifU-like protein
MSADLYHERLVALARAANGAGRLAPPARSGEADNPLCGDRVRITLRLDGDRIVALAHETRGCLLCAAAAAAIGRHAPGAGTGEIARTSAALRAWLKDGAALPAGSWPELADFEPVRAVRSRHDCVLLAFEAVRNALEQPEN